MTGAGASVAEKDTDALPRDQSGFAVFHKVPGKGLVPSGAPVPVPGSEGFRRLPRRLSTVRELGGSWIGEKGKDEKGAGLRLTPRCQEHRLGGAASFPWIGLSAQGAGGGAPVLSPSQLRAAPRAE